MADGLGMARESKQSNLLVTQIDPDLHRVFFDDNCMKRFSPCNCEKGGKKW